MPSTRRWAVAVVAAWAVWASGAADVEADRSVAAFPRADGEADDAGRIQRAIDATGRGGVLYFPGGDYEVARPLVVTNGVSLLLHKSAKVAAVAKMDSVFRIDCKSSGWFDDPEVPGRRIDMNLFFRGGHVDGCGLASCVSLNRYFHYTLRDVTFLNGYPYGLHVGPSGCEIVADNLYFRTHRSGLAGNVGLFTEGRDSQYRDCIVVDYTVGVKVLGGANRFTRMHAWGGMVPPAKAGEAPEMLKDSVCFFLGGNANTFRDCYADTGKIGYDVYGWGQQILGCWYLNAPHHRLDDVTIVRQAPDSVKLLVADCVFRKNMPHTRVYSGPGRVKWSNMVYKSFPDDADKPGEINP